jgi:hypothetical protein
MGWSRQMRKIGRILGAWNGDGEKKGRGVNGANGITGAFLGAVLIPRAEAGLCVIGRHF